MLYRAPPQPSWLIRSPIICFVVVNQSQCFYRRYRLWSHIGEKLVFRRTVLKWKLLVCYPYWLMSRLSPYDLCSRLENVLLTLVSAMHAMMGSWWRFSEICCQKHVALLLDESACFSGSWPSPDLTGGIYDIFGLHRIRAIRMVQSLHHHKNLINHGWPIKWQFGRGDSLWRNKKEERGSSNIARIVIPKRKYKVRNAMWDHKR